MNDELTHLDLFSGIGGFSIAAEWAGFRTVAFSEIDPEASLVLREWWPLVPNLGNVAGIHATVGRIDLLTGGVPCQPASLLGKRLGSADERWLWPEALRIVRELRPGFAVFENPPAILGLEDGRAFSGILGGLAALRYDVLWGIVPAAAIGAGHLRERVFIVASDADDINRRSGPGTLEREETHHEASANANHAGLQGYARDGEGTQRWHEPDRPTAPRDLRGTVRGGDWWHEAHTGIPVLAHGIPARLAQAACRCAGNAVVPQAAYPILKAIHGILTKTP